MTSASTSTSGWNSSWWLPTNISRIISINCGFNDHECVDRIYRDYDPNAMNQLFSCWWDGDYLFLSPPSTSKYEGGLVGFSFGIVFAFAALVGMMYLIIRKCQKCRDYHHQGQRKQPLWGDFMVSEQPNQSNQSNRFTPSAPVDHDTEGVSTSENNEHYETGISSNDGHYVVSPDIEGERPHDTKHCCA